MPHPLSPLVWWWCVCWSATPLVTACVVVVCTWECHTPCHHLCGGGVYVGVPHPLSPLVWWWCVRGSATPPVTTCVVVVCMLECHTPCHHLCGGGVYVRVPRPLSPLVWWWCVCAVVVCEVCELWYIGTESVYISNRG